MGSISSWYSSFRDVEFAIECALQPCPRSIKNGISYPLHHLYQLCSLLDSSVGDSRLSQVVMLLWRSYGKLYFCLDNLLVT